MDSLPDLVLNHILSFLDKDICHKNKNDLSILLSNKYISAFYKKHYEYRIHDYIDLSEYKNILRLNIPYKPQLLSYMFCTNKKCGMFTIKELNELSGILKCYKRLCEEGTLCNKYNIYNNKTDEDSRSMFIHFNNSKELENFRIKIYKSKMNIWLDSNTCCNGKGCSIEIN
tara:strand:- start:1364 stop:1876 length:513 start_codon:yes stop_codon:yes gene_type:complete